MKYIVLTSEQWARLNTAVDFLHGEGSELASQGVDTDAMEARAIEIDAVLAEVAAANGLE